MSPFIVNGNYTLFCMPMILPLCWVFLEGEQSYVFIVMYGVSVISMLCMVLLWCKLYIVKIIAFYHFKKDLMHIAS